MKGWPTWRGGRERDDPGEGEEEREERKKLRVGWVFCFKSHSFCLQQLLPAR